MPTLLLHSCCAPCSSYCLEYLSNYFKITVFYYNPNIYPEEEYRKRVAEQQKFIEKLPVKYPIHFVEGAYEKERFYEMAKGLEDCPEGGERCFLCYELRLREAAELTDFAQEHRGRIAFWQFVQYLFYRQWREMRAYAAARG